VADGSAARRRIEASFAAFREVFPAALCYTKIVPVDEVVTLTLFHREDQHLSRLLLDDRQKARLDSLCGLGVCQLNGGKLFLQFAQRIVQRFQRVFHHAPQECRPGLFLPIDIALPFCVPFVLVTFHDCPFTIV